MKKLKKRILAIETSTEACSVAILDGCELVNSTKTAPRQHTQLILPMIQDLLVKADLTLNQLDVIAVGRGPGSFTGVRIAISVAQGLAFGANLNVVPVSTLEAMALGAFDAAVGGSQSALVGVALDARMQEIYWGLYQVSRNVDSVENVACADIEIITQEQVCRADQVALLKPQLKSQLKSKDAAVPFIGVGSGWCDYLETISQKLGLTPDFRLPEHTPNATFVAKLALKKLIAGEAALPPEAVEPVYLRNPFAKPQS